MELLADRDPEEARKLLDPVIARMMEAVHHYEGMVNQVMGDKPRQVGTPTEIYEHPAASSPVRRHSNRRREFRRPFRVCAR